MVAGEAGLGEAVVVFKGQAGGEGFLQAGDGHGLRPHARIRGAGGRVYAAQGFAKNDLALALGVAAVDDFAAGVRGGGLAEQRKQALGVGARFFDEIPELGWHDGQIVDVPRAEFRVVGFGFGQLEKVPARGDDGEFGAVGHQAAVRTLAGEMSPRECRREVAPCSGLFGDEEDLGHESNVVGRNQRRQSRCRAAAKKKTAEPGMNLNRRFGLKERAP